MKKINNNFKKILIKNYIPIYLFLYFIFCIIFYFFLVDSLNYFSIYCNTSIYDLLYADKNSFPLIKRYYFFTGNQFLQFLQKFCPKSDEIIWFSNPEEFYNSENYSVWKHFFLASYFVCYSFNGSDSRFVSNQWPEIIDLIKLENPFTKEQIIIGVKGTSPENPVQKAYISNRMIYQGIKLTIPEPLVERVHISEFTSLHDRHLLRYKKAIFCLLSSNEEKKFLEELFKKKINES